MTFAKQLLALSLVAIVLVTLVPGTTFGETAEGLRPLSVDARWDTELLDTQRVMLPRPAERMQRIGNTLAAVMLPEGCASCDTRDLALFIRGQVSYVEGVPVAALATERVLRNEGRLVWAAQVEGSNARYDVYELNPQTGVAELRFEELFLGSSSQADVFVKGAQFYFAVAGLQETDYVHLKTIAYTHKRLFTVGTAWRASQTEVLDIHEDGTVLTRLTFPSGDQELWLHDRVSSRAIAGSYTIDGYLMGAQFVGDDVEFFRYQTLMHYDRDLWKTTEIGDTLAWLPSQQEQERWLAAYNDILFYVTFNEDLHQHTVVRRKGGVSTDLGTFSDTALHRVGLHVQFRQAEEFVDGMVRYSLATGLKIAEVGGLTAFDALGSSTAGIDRKGLIHWSNGDDTTTIGYGTTAYLEDQTHVYWMGVDGLLRMTTIKPTVWLKQDVEFAKAENDPTVYLFDGGVRYTVQDEETYYSWRRQFSDIRSLSDYNLQAYVDAGWAPYAPGSLVRGLADPAVYLVLNATEMQVIYSEEEANALFGHGWWQEVHWLTEAELSRYVVVK